MKRELKSMEQVRQEVAAKLPDAVLTPDKDWLWVTSPELAPAHKVKGGCQCETCEARAQKREVLKAIGFRFAFRPHKLPDGTESRWAHCCSHPTRFKKKDKPTENAEAPANSNDNELADAEAFFNNV